MCVRARRLWDDVDRPSLMIEVPATREGVAALEVLVAAGEGERLGEEAARPVAEAWAK